MNMRGSLVACLMFGWANTELKVKCSLMLSGCKRLSIFLFLYAYRKTEFFREMISVRHVFTHNVIDTLCDAVIVFVIILLNNNKNLYSIKASKASSVQCLVLGHIARKWGGTASWTPNPRVCRWLPYQLIHKPNACAVKSMYNCSRLLCMCVCLKYRS